MKTKRVPDQARIIGKNIKKLRQARGLRQSDIAVMLDVTFQQIQKYERGTNRLPVEKLHILKQCLAVPYEVFFENMEEESSAIKDIEKQLQEEITSLQDPALILSLWQLIKAMKQQRATLQ